MEDYRFRLAAIQFGRFAGIQCSGDRSLNAWKTNTTG